MSLTAFSIANFKAFAASQRIPLRPITLIYGANSSGKSSAIHALALAHHAIETGDLDIQRPRIGGEAIDLGGFRQYVHRREWARQVELGFELDPTRLNGSGAELVSAAREIRVELAIGKGFASEQQTLFGDKARAFDPDGATRVERFALDVDGEFLLAMSARRGRLLGMDRLEPGHAIIRDLCRRRLNQFNIGQESKEVAFDTYERALNFLVPNVTASNRGLFPRIENVPETNAAHAEVRDRVVHDFIPLDALRDLMEGIGVALEDELGRLHYLGPLRSYTPRHLAFSQHHDPNRFAGGGYAWDVVRDNPEVRSLVNQWLGDSERLKTPYELQVRDLLQADMVSGEVPAKLRKAMHDLLASLLSRMDARELIDLKVLADRRAEQIAELDPEDEEDLIPDIEELLSSMSDEGEISDRWVEEMVAARSDAIQQLVLVDKRTGTPVSHRDVGIGVSQVLPVLVSAYASNNKLLAIEQPEIHLHPALQAELGDVFLESALGDNGNTFLIETHSEHLLLRILRRIRETTDGELPEGSLPVQPYQVAVLFVQPGAHDTEVIEIPVTPEGEFERTWPGGFFTERAEELF
ncbi:MAG: AAA family ATPase [Gemmatimonadota bacterium]|nr:AAA family ATPase [Gemmatimonadota bacterium]